MEPLPLQFFADASGGRLVHGDGAVVVLRVVTDSRDARPGDLFVALRGERFDAHDFLADVAARGVAAVLVSEAFAGRLPDGLTAIAVPDTRIALGRIAAVYRARLQVRMACVSGSNGKTTTKELLAALLSTGLRTLRSEASFNNDIGVPLSLLRIGPGHEAAVLEAGTNHPGELAPLVRMIAPHVGLVPSIGREHLEHFGDLDGVIRHPLDIACIAASCSGAASAEFPAGWWVQAQQISQQLGGTTFSGITFDLLRVGHWSASRSR
jgi:UDP-N-acetylmuramoyl-tripeptide--D-alanyl-D-alanine ligase